MCMLVLVGSLMMIIGNSKVSFDNRLNKFWRAIFAMSKYAVYRVSKTSSMVNGIVFLSWCLCGLHSNILYSISNKLMYCCRWFKFVNSMMHLPVRLFVRLYCFIIKQIYFASCLKILKMNLWERFSFTKKN